MRFGRFIGLFCLLCFFPAVQSDFFFSCSLAVRHDLQHDRGPVIHVFTAKLTKNEKKVQDSGDGGLKGCTVLGVRSRDD